MIGATRQRCRVHFLRIVLGVVSKGSAEMVAAAMRTIFAQTRRRARPRPARRHRYRARQTVPQGRGDAAAEGNDITAFADFPVAHWKKIWSTDPLERVKREVKRRPYVVGVFPNPAALHRLAGRILIETHDEWQIA